MPETESSKVVCPNCNWSGMMTVTLHTYSINRGKYAEWICPRCNKHYGKTESGDLD